MPTSLPDKALGRAFRNLLEGVAADGRCIGRVVEFTRKAQSSRGVVAAEGS